MSGMLQVRGEPIASALPHFGREDMANARLDEIAESIGGVGVAVSAGNAFDTGSDFADWAAVIQFAEVQVQGSRGNGRRDV